jgi:hypothetical protein
VSDQDVTITITLPPDATARSRLAALSRARVTEPRLVAQAVGQILAMVLRPYPAPPAVEAPAPPAEKPAKGARGPKRRRPSSRGVHQRARQRLRRLSNQG